MRDYFSALLILIATASITRSESLFAVRYGNNSNGNPVYEIDAATGIGTAITGLPNLAFANSLTARDRRALYTVASDTQDGFKEKLVRIDPTIFQVNVSVGPTLFTSQLNLSTSIDALAYHQNFGLLGIELNDNLVRVNIESGEVTLIGHIGTPGQPIGIQGLAFSPDGSLFGWGVERFGLIRISPTTASYQVIGGGPSGTIQALTFSPDGSTLYGAGETLFRINTQTGSRTAIGSGVGFDDVRGIAFATGEPVPEPSGALIALGSLALFGAELYRRTNQKRLILDAARFPTVVNAILILR